MEVAKVGDHVTSNGRHTYSRYALKRGRCVRVVEVYPSTHADSPFTYRFAGVKGSYKAVNFDIVNKRQKEETPMSNSLHVALSVRGKGYVQIANQISDSQDLNGQHAMSDTSAEVLKQKIRDRLREYPDEKWLILSGTVLGEIEQAPVRFRSVG